MTSLVVTVQPTKHALSIDDVRTHSRIDSTVENSYIQALIDAATERVQFYTRRCLMQQTLVYRLDRFTSDGVILLPRAPVSSVTSINYIDTDGAVKTLATTVYDVDIYAEQPYVYLKYGQVWPTTRAIQNAVEVTFIAGHANADEVPSGIKHAMLVLIDNMYEHRGNVVTGTIVSTLPDSFVEALLAPHRSHF